MDIVKADEATAGLIGQIHSTAWKQAYQNIFPGDYILQDSSTKREKECIDTLRNQSGNYYLINSGNIPIGIIKTSMKESDVCEVESMYLLKEFQSKGYGTAAMDFIKNEFTNKTIILWVLEINHNAIDFYKKNNFIFSGKKRKIIRGNEYTQLLFTYPSFAIIK